MSHFAENVESDELDVADTTSMNSTTLPQICSNNNQETSHQKQMKENEIPI